MTIALQRSILLCKSIKVDIGVLCQVRLNNENQISKVILTIKELLVCCMALVPAMLMIVEQMEAKKDLAIK